MRGINKPGAIIYFVSPTCKIIKPKPLPEPLPPKFFKLNSHHYEI
jgi:hypothetical protein